jgi:prophage antirepressor-like protein
MSNTQNPISQVVHPVFGTTTIFTNSNGKHAWIASEICKKLKHTNITQAIIAAELKNGEDYIIIKKKEHKNFFEQLTNFKLVTPNTPSITLIFESGLWLLCQNSKKEVGQKLRRWLADEVLPSIMRTGKYEYTKKFSISNQDILNQTKREVQISNSKKVNDKNYSKHGLKEVINYNVQNCKQVSGMTPEEVKIKLDKQLSAKENFRRHHPELAATMSMNDHLIVNDDNLSLPELKSLDESLIRTFQELQALGIEIKQID